MIKSRNSYRKKTRTWGVTFKGLILLSLITLGLFLSTIFTRQNQDLRQKASSQAKAQVSLRGVTLDDSRLRIDVLLNTYANALAAFDISGALSGASLEKTTLSEGGVLVTSPVYTRLEPSSGGVAFRIVRFASLSPLDLTSTSGQSVTIFSFVVTNPSNDAVSVTLNASSSLVSLVNLVSPLVSLPTGTTPFYIAKSVTPTPQPTATATPTPEPSGGFLIRGYFDSNGNGKQDSGESGLSRKYVWDSNADGNWREYETFAAKNGEGGVVTLPVGTQVRIKALESQGWTATSPTQPVIYIRENQNQLMVFGSQQNAKFSPPPTAKLTTSPKPTAKIATPTPTPLVTPTPTPSPTPLATLKPSPVDLETKVDLIPTPLPTYEPVETISSTSSRFPIGTAIIIFLVVSGSLGLLYTLYLRSK